jgi:hypothetical protein
MPNNGMHPTRTSAALIENLSVSAARAGGDAGRSAAATIRLQSGLK